MRPVVNCTNQLDPERLRTAQHEMSHALVSFALKCQDIKVVVFKKPKKHPATKSKLLGVCTQRFPKDQYRIFSTCGPFASKLYTPDEYDKPEFEDMMKDFVEMTGQPNKYFKHMVCDPVQELLDSQPAIEIITRFVIPLAKGGILRCKLPSDMEKFFPTGINRALFRELCDNVKSAADVLPIKKSLQQSNSSNCVVRVNTKLRT